MLVLLGSAIYVTKNIWQGGKWKTMIQSNGTAA